MSKCHISIEVGDVKNRAELMKKAKSALSKHGGKLEGDDESGTFELNIVIGKISGNYTIDESTFNLDVTQKPILVTCKRIETEIRRYMV